MTVLAAGWLLGGSVGAGTVLYAVLIGPITHRTIPLFTPENERAERVATPLILASGAMSLREALVGLIEEYARHMGHADLLRERIDGRIGQ